MATFLRTKLTASALGASDSADTTRAPAGQAWVQTSGDFVGTATLQVTLDGTTWVDSAYGAVAPGQYAVVPELASSVRINVTAYTSGTLAAVVGCSG